MIASDYFWSTNDFSETSKFTPTHKLHELQVALHIATYVSSYNNSFLIPYLGFHPTFTLKIPTHVLTPIPSWFYSIPKHLFVFVVVQLFIVLRCCSSSKKFNMSMLESEPESGVEIIDLTLDEEDPDT